MANTLSFANSVDITDAAVFIPEVWSDEIIATERANLIMVNVSSRLNHKGRKGDTIHIPSPTRGSASAKSPNNVVTLITSTDNDIPILIDQHYEYSKNIEDIVEVQAMSSLRRFYTEDAGYALATKKDDTLIALAATWNGGTAYSAAVIGSDGSTAYDPTANTNTGNGAAISDGGLRRAIQTLDDNNVPLMGRSLVLPPVEKRRMLGIPRFTEQAFVGEGMENNSVRTGMIGNVYGHPVYVTSRCATVTATDASTQYRACLLFHKQGIVIAEQMGIRSQTQYKQENLGWLFTADALWGIKTLRSTTHVLAIMVPRL